MKSRRQQTWKLRVIRQAGNWKFPCRIVATDGSVKRRQFERYETKSGKVLLSSFRKSGNIVRDTGAGIFRAESSPRIPGRKEGNGASPQEQSALSICAAGCRESNPNVTGMSPQQLSMGNSETEISRGRRSWEAPIRFCGWKQN